MKTKLALRMDLDVSDLSTESSHVCEKCVVHWTHEMLEMVEELPNMEHSVEEGIRPSPLRRSRAWYIAGSSLKQVVIVRIRDVSDHDSITGAHLRTKDKFLSNFYWSGVDGDVTRYCRSCDVSHRTVKKVSCQNSLVDTRAYQPTE
ncbi:Zinc finger protein [Plakobranchus ocellatus]|uniref:Zinc finger protein n=1 Tax=Plakobranchus ocellatus TaxID=259542 RepID=A0AAV3Y4P7_9GAST|nr:Zinc finger protein [Plakobranchus ocellatus]